MEEDTVICLIWHVPFWTYYLLPMKGIHEIKVKVSGYNVIYSLQGRLRGRRHTSTESQSQSPTSSLVWSSLASQRGKINSNWSSSTRRWAVTRDDATCRHVCVSRGTWPWCRRVSRTSGAPPRTCTWSPTGGTTWWSPCRFPWWSISRMTCLQSSWF